MFIFFITSCDLAINEKTYELKDYENIIYDDFIVPKSDNPDGIKIIYDCNNGFVYESTVTKSNRILEPSTNPSKVCSKFLGWFSDKECKIPYNFSNIVLEEKTIYAGYEQNLDELVTYMYLNTVKANIKVTSQPKTKYSASDTYSQGSGVIFFQDEDCYYFLTNNHVTYYDHDEWTGAIYSAYDCYGNEMPAHLIMEDSNYDLAILAIDKDDTDHIYTVLPIANNDLETNDFCASISNPTGLYNALSIGIVEGYDKFEPKNIEKEKNNIKFDVLINTATIKNGSSGGMLLDDNLHIAGIQFAAAEDSRGDYIYSYAVPASKVLEYINIVNKNSTV